MNKTMTHKNRYLVKVKPETEESSSWGWITTSLVIGGVLAFFALLILVDIGKIKGPLAVIVTVIYLGLMIAEFVMDLCGDSNTVDADDDDESD